MSVIQIVIVLIVLEFVWWIFSRYVLPHVPEPFKTAIVIVLALAACLWLLSIAGLIPNLSGPLWRKGP
jgi:hypothetical protein